MITRRHVESDLKKLDRLYRATVAGTDARLPVYYSKLAVLECTGWIEVSFDLIAQRAVKGQLKSRKFSDQLKDTIKRTYGFDYDKNFLQMMTRIIGLAACERLEDALASNGRLSILQGEIGALLSQRNTAAHVAVSFTTITFDSPSVTHRRFVRLYPIIRDIYRLFC